MASTYALPASAMTHHHGHNHIHSHSHSHSHSPSGRYPANTPRSMKHERSTGSLHMHSRSEAIPEHDHRRGHSHNSSQVRAHSPLGYPTPPDSDCLPAAPFEKHTHESSLEYPHSNSYEPPANAVSAITHDHDHKHSHSHVSVVEPRSRFTTFLLPLARRWPLLHTILAEKDSRRIFYFMSLNFAFMLVQAFYGFITDSLGLLSDSIHMFFDCLALAVGLYAAVASKWPPSERFPYGFGKIESLSGFGNGVFLMLISVEILIEATERLAEGRTTKRLMELFVVSGLGLAVNLVGMACFGHHHHGHDHGHDHGHGHSHSHGHDHGHDYSDSHSHSHESGHTHSHSHDEKEQCDHGHDHGHGHDHEPHATSLTKSAGSSHFAGHSHSHDNENMHGIFLHVLADTMGSAAVMVSTALIHFLGWPGWDPLASCVIAILIFMSSIPLIKSCAKKLLLTVPDDVEYNLRDTLASVSSLRGVASYTTPRFWMGDKHSEHGNEPQVLGVMHIMATRGSDLEDVKERATALLTSHGMNIVIQVEAFGETSCWCGGGSRSTPSRLSS